MYGLAVNLIVSVSGHPWIIDEIYHTYVIMYVVYLSCDFVTKMMIKKII